MRKTDEIMATLTRVADDPNAYAENWKRAHEGKVIGVFPMNFPTELVHASVYE